jgi:HD-GYP domain-containing protein (c-di-GMP phosphodiesterase class II)
MIDLRAYDDYTFYHSVNVGVLSVTVGAALGLNKKQLHNLCLAALLHDIGKVFIPKEIVNKPEKLTDEEFKIIKTHSIKGYEYIREKFDIPVSSYIGVLQHHERYDGTGYPFSIEGNKISMFGKIIAASDVYDALVSSRPYRKAVLPSEAMEYIMGGSGSYFDALIVNTFTQRIAPYPVGTCVLMSDGRCGIVVENYYNCCLRPKIKVVAHYPTKVEPYFIDLKNDRTTIDLTIVGISDFM